MGDIAANINKLIALEGISASDLSRKTGIDRSVLHKIITGATKNPTIDSIKSIIQHYGFDEVVFGINSIKNEHNGIPIISWSEAATMTPNSRIENRLKTIKLGIEVPPKTFGLLIEYTLDSRFPEGTVLIVDQKKEPKNLSYVITADIETKSSSIKRYILDGGTIYLKAIDPSFPSVRYEADKFRIVGVVIQSIFDFE